MLQALERHDLRRWEVRRVADGGKELQGSTDGRFEKFGEVKASETMQSTPTRIFLIVVKRQSRAWCGLSNSLLKRCHYES